MACPSSCNYGLQEAGPQGSIVNLRKQSTCYMVTRRGGPLGHIRCSSSSTSHRCLTPLRARIYRVEKALPLSSMSRKTVARSLEATRCASRNPAGSRGSAPPSVPANSPAVPDDVDPHPLGLVGLADNADLREFEPSSVDAHERGGALPVVGAVPALAEETAGVEPAGEAEKAMAAKPEALASWTQGEAGREVETPP
jgi:hypothetical protein